MSGFSRGGPMGSRNAMRPPTRPATSRLHSVAPPASGRASPTESVVSVATNASTLRSPTRSNFGGTKRKDRDFEHDGHEETNINVVVRCRGRNEREVRENSGVVVSTNGVKGNKVELSMGPSALSNKTYQFDKVFSSAADQNMLFQEVVAPILDEVLGGFNCTIFAYGQTGTGKTYTMSGDITDTLPLPDAAGIIPRVLHALFEKLDGDDAESSVKCSFIELYNEELRDLLSPDDNVKLKIFEEGKNKGHLTTMVQGMEESHIRSASKGIKLLRDGSVKRQVAATKCNDLSSRSHTVFTITVYSKRTSETGEEFVNTGKLNLVDLAGSENIQRSGAENKRAAEAGLINKSLLTLGRVINALVDRSSHIPYRESKLTRLLQDSLGGRTKTCIIATLSPAKSNLEETISTLDYAFRAKNIRNKPQVNQMVPKKAKLNELAAEIEKLKSELIATRQRNGVYLTQENYELITAESESRRILSEEQRDKIETMETNLRNKVQELFSLTSSFNVLKKDNEAIRLVLEGTKSILEKTEVVLNHTRQNLAEETMLRKAHQATEQDLQTVGQELIAKLGETTSDIGGLRSKLRRRSDLHCVNRGQWSDVQRSVGSTTEMVEDRLEQLQTQQTSLMASLSARMQGFVQGELQKLKDNQHFLQEKMRAFEQSQAEVNDQTSTARDEMNGVLEEIKILREDVKEKVGAGLDGLSAAAERISAGIANELEAFHTQLHSSYLSLGRDFKNTFEDLTKHLTEQKIEAERLRGQISEADQGLFGAASKAQVDLQSFLVEEKKAAAAERERLSADIARLIQASAEDQEKRVTTRLIGLHNGLAAAKSDFSATQTRYNQGMDDWSGKEDELAETIQKATRTVKAKIQGDWQAAETRITSTKATTQSVRDETVRIVDAQMAHMDVQLQALDEVVSRIRAQNNEHHTAHTSSLAELGSTVQASYSSIDSHFKTSFSRVQTLDTDMADGISTLQDTLPQLSEQEHIRGPLQQLRDEITHLYLAEYIPTGETPQKTTYQYPLALPQTESHEDLLARMRGNPTVSSNERSPTKAKIFLDAASDKPTLIDAAAIELPPSRPASSSLRELDVNTLPSALQADPISSSTDEATTGILMPPLKRQNTNTLSSLSSGIKLEKPSLESSKSESRLPTKKAARMTVAGGVENVPLVAGDKLSASVGPGSVGGRKLRSHGSS